MRVRRGNLKLLKVVENIELGEVKRGVVVTGVRVLEDNEIEPTATALAAGCDTDLVTNLLKGLANLVQLLGREGATEQN